MTESVPRITKRTSVSELGTDRNHAPVGQARNDDSSKHQDIPVAMENNHPEGTEEQYFISPSIEALLRN